MKTFKKQRMYLLLFKNSNLFIKTVILNFSVTLGRALVLNSYLFLFSSRLAKSNFKLQKRITLFWLVRQHRSEKSLWSMYSREKIPLKQVQHQENPCETSAAARKFLWGKYTSGKIFVYELLYFLKWNF